MGIKKFKPVTPSLRKMSVLSKDGVAKKSLAPKSLFSSTSNTSGRNNLGRITSRYRGGQVKRKYRHIDFKRLKENVPA